MLHGNSSASGGQATDTSSYSHDWPNALDELRGAYAASTISGYKRDFSLFEEWCRDRHLCALPCAPETLVRYLDEKIVTLRSATLVRRLAAVVRVHRLLNLDSPADSERVRLARRRIQRYRPNRPRQALGIDRDLRAAMLACCTQALADQRDKVLVALGFEGLCRRSEIAALTFDDVVHNRLGRLALLIRRGKADQMGDGRIITLSQETAALLTRWLAVAQIEEGPLIRPVYRGSAVNRHMAGFSIARLLKAIATRAGVDTEGVEQISGHSLRVGAAQTLLQDGHDLLRLMKAGGWKSASTVLRYVDRTEVNVWTDQTPVAPSICKPE
jgi:integrase/recombinase XerD